MSEFFKQHPVLCEIFGAAAGATAAAVVIGGSLAVGSIVASIHPVLGVAAFLAGASGAAPIFDETAHEVGWKLRGLS